MQIIHGIATLAALAAAVAGATPLAAQDHSQHSMSHEGMPALRPIPPGALHTIPDVQFMQGMIAHHGAGDPHVAAGR